MIRGEAHQEDEDGAADQLPDPHLLIGLCAGAAAHGAEDAAVADLHTKTAAVMVRFITPRNSEFMTFNTLPEMPEFSIQYGCPHH